MAAACPIGEGTATSRGPSGWLLAEVRSLPIRHATAPDVSAACGVAATPGRSRARLSGVRVASRPAAQKGRAVLDGGKTQIKVAKEVLNDLKLNIPIVGLVKDDKHKTSYVMNSNYELLNLNSKSNLFLFLTRIQEEVHRYAISYHRNIKSKGMLASVLDMAPGIGEVRRRELLKKFGSLKKIKEASVQDLEEVVGNTVAFKLYNYLKEIEKENL